MLIARQAVKEFLNRELDDFRWMKKLREDQVLAEIARLKVQPRFKTKPWLHQLVCFYIGLLYPRFMFLLDMGAGKTFIVNMLIEQLLREGKLDRALVTVPRRFNMLSWEEDIPKHTELEPWIIEVEDVEAKWEALRKPKGDVSVINIQGLILACCDKVKKGKGKGYQLDWNEKKVRELLRTYNLLCLDEIHKLSGRETVWFSLLNQLSKGMDFSYGLTGTLFGKDVEAMWGPFYLIDRGETLGDTLGPFRGAFFDTKMNPWKGQVHKFRKDMKETLNRTIQHRSIRYEESEMHDLPKKMVRPLYFNMGTEQREHYMRALEGLINAGGDVRELKGQWLRMRQIVSGYLAWKDDSGDHVLPFKENPKLDALEELVENTGDSKLVISYEYTATGRMIVERLKQMKIGHEWLWGGTKSVRNLRERFLEDRNCPILVMQSDAGGTGTDGLQNVARYLAFYETPSDPRTRLQTEKRIGRPGQTRRWAVYDLIMRGSVDVGILDGIKEGIDVMEAVVNGKKKGKGFFLGD